MFEMLLSLEELERCDPIDDAVERYRRFAALQDLRHRAAIRRYNEASGRSSPNDPRSADKIEEFCAQTFPEFLTVTKKGRRIWADYWHGHTVRELAHRSDSQMRPVQYETLYRFLSAYSHGAPVSIVGGFAEVVGGRTPFSDMEDHLAREDREIGMIVAMLVAYYLEIWRTCSPPLAYSAQSAFEWTQRIKDHYGPLE